MLHLRNNCHLNCIMICPILVGCVSYNPVGDMVTREKIMRSNWKMKILTVKILWHKIYLLVCGGGGRGGDGGPGVSFMPSGIKKLRNYFSLASTVSFFNFQVKKYLTTHMEPMKSCLLSGRPEWDSEAASTYLLTNLIFISFTENCIWVFCALSRLSSASV